MCAAGSRAQSEAARCLSRAPARVEAQEEVSESWQDRSGPARGRTHDVGLRFLEVGLLQLLERCRLLIVARPAVLDIVSDARGDPLLGVLQGPRWCGEQANGQHSARLLSSSCRTSRILVSCCRCGEDGAYFEIGQWREDLLSNSVGERPPALDLLLAILEDLAPGSSDRRERISLIVLAVGSGRGAAAVVSPGESEGSDGLAVARAARLAQGKPGEGDDGPKRIRARVECPGPLRQKLELIRAARDIQEE